MGQHGFIHDVALSCFEGAVEVSEFQNIFAFRAVRPDVVHQDDTALGERACFVGTEHVHGTQILY